MSSFYTFLQCIATVTMMNFSKYKSVYVSLLYKTAVGFLLHQKKIQTPCLASKATTYGPLFMYYTLPMLGVYSCVSCFCSQMCWLFLIQGFLPHFHSGICPSLGLMFPPQNGFSWPQSAIFSCCTPSIACFLCNTICNCMFVKFLSIFSLVP